MVPFIMLISVLVWASMQAMEPAQEKAKNPVQAIVADATDFARAKAIVDQLDDVELHTQLVNSGSIESFIEDENSANLSKPKDETGSFKPVSFDFDSVSHTSSNNPKEAATEMVAVEGHSESLAVSKSTAVEAQAKQAAHELVGWSKIPNLSHEEFYGTMARTLEYTRAPAARLLKRAYKTNDPDTIFLAENICHAESVTVLERYLQEFGRLPGLPKKIEKDDKKKD